jgi:OOP family OmpA-OmpF porin
MKRIYNFFFLLLPTGFAVFFYPPARAQAGSLLVTGIVREYKKTTPLTASVIFEKQPDASVTVVSDAGGSGYKATIGLRDSFLIKVSAPGYLPQYRMVDFGADSSLGRETFRFDFELVPIAVLSILPFGNLVFEPSSPKILPQSYRELDLLVAIMKENPGIIVQLEGHTDNQSQSGRIRKLARARVRAIRTWLTDRGIAGKRIKMKAIGGGHQIEKVNTPGAHQANRRVEIRILEM